MSRAKRIDPISTMMIFENHIPPPPFDDFIDSFIYFQGYCPEHNIERKVPDGLVNLVFELDGIKRFVYENNADTIRCCCTRVWISGMHRKFITLSAHPDSEMFIISFKPGGAYPFLHKPVSHFTEKILDGAAAFGNEIFAFREKLLQAPDFSAKFRVAEKWLADQVDFSITPERAIQEAVACVHDNTTTRLDEIVVQSRYSRKQFIHLFKKYVGLTPKLYQRIVRFNEILQKVHQGEFVSWAQISADCGYFDQAHFIRDFKEFSGFNPSEFLKAHVKSERINFFPFD